MYGIELGYFALKCVIQRRRPIKSSQQRTRKIPDLNAVQINRNPDGHTTVSRPVNVRSKDLEVMPSRR
jgi:hypothetical protein